MNQDGLIPTFSRGERDRRWGLVRRRMAAEKFDCLIGFPNQGRFEQLQANTRYLTAMGGFACEIAVVFPRDGEVTSFVQSGRDIAWWKEAQDWVTDLRNCRRLWSDGIVTRLKELKLTRGRIGVIGLKGLIRAPEGVVPWLSFERVKEALPEAEFVSATEIVLETRAVKSAEEIDFITEAARLAALQGAEILFYPTAIGWHPGEKAEFGVNQHAAWEIMQRSHAVANGCFVAAVNRVGHEGASDGGIEFWGQSFVADPSGEVVWRAPIDQPATEVVSLDLAQLDFARTHWPFLRDRRIDAYAPITKRFLDGE